jgi:hypothetical protein
MKRKAGFLAADEKHFFAHTGANRIHATSGRPHVLAVRGHRLHQQQLDPLEEWILDRADDISDHAGELHGSYSATSTVSMMPTMAASTGVSFISGGHARGTAADDEHGFADAGVHRVDGDEVVAFRLAARVNGRTSSSLLLTSRGSFRVATTVPTITSE